MPLATVQNIARDIQAAVIKRRINQEPTMPAAQTQSPQPAPEHTPGPWQFITQADWPHTQIVHVTAENWGVIANLRLDPGMPHLVEQQQANLRLIAAAPELLAFAREFLTDYQSEDGMATMKHYAGKAHTAIAKYLGLHQ